jgi:hypothetical protein
MRQVALLDLSVIHPFVRHLHSSLAPISTAALGSTVRSILLMTFNLYDRNTVVTYLVAYAWPLVSRRTHDGRATPPVVEQLHR